MSAERRRITYLSGTRADFGLMRRTLQETAQLADLSVIATGTHLERAFGHTVDEIEAAGLRVSARVPIDVTTRTPQSMSAGIGECLKGVTEALVHERPDALLLLGDRGEMLAGAIAALHLGIPCVHIHGGERSGTVDEPVRHAISKLASYHLVATQESRERLERMGEAAERIFVTGAPGLDGLVESAAMSADEVTLALGLPLGRPFVLVLFHPVVQQAGDAHAQTLQVIAALRETGLPVAWLEPNADAGSLEILRALDESPLPEGSRRIKHLERSLFSSAMRHCAVMAGNSSAGIIEAASFGTPVINIGERQRLRERNANVTDVPPATEAVLAAISAALTHGRWPCDNLWGVGHSAPRIARLLADLPLPYSLLEKANVY
jgi:GDP/UDP-N,N'-diacetylbacillosamine 2-epimerase (hydrolysing)